LKKTEAKPREAFYIPAGSGTENVYQPVTCRNGFKRDQRMDGVFYA